MGDVDESLNTNEAYDRLSNCSERLRRELERHQLQFPFKDFVIIDDELHISLTKLAQISDSDRRDILDACYARKNSVITDTVYWKNTEIALKKNRVRMQYQRREAIAQLEKVFQTENLESAKIGNEYIFQNMTPSELDRLADVMTSSAKNYDPKILEIANRFAEMRYCETPRDYANYVEFTSKYLSDLRAREESEYRNALNDAGIKGPVNKILFDKAYGILGKRPDFFTNKVLNNFMTNSDESFRALDDLYSNFKNTVLPVNTRSNPRFASDSAAIYHFFKHSKVGDKQLTPEQYFNIASELVNEPENLRLLMLNQQGDVEMYTYTDPSNCAKGVVFEKSEDKTRSLATFYFDTRKRGH